MSDAIEKDNITKAGNPAKPTGDAGIEMLKRMNESHFEVTGWALSKWDIRENHDVLDIGCGGGRTLNRISEKIVSGSLTGVDYSETSIRASEEYNRELLNKGMLTLVNASVENLPFEDGAFDRIITVESFYFWPDPVENLKEVRRVLRKDGHFMLVADIYGREDLSEHQRENIAEYDLTNPTIDEFRQLFEKAGFDEISIHLRNNTSWIAVEGIKN